MRDRRICSWLATVGEIVRYRSNCIDCSSSSCRWVGDDCGNALTLLGGVSLFSVSFFTVSFFTASCFSVSLLGDLEEPRDTASGCLCVEQGSFCIYKRVGR